MGSEEVEPPRKGEYGDTTRRCAWCGRKYDSVIPSKRYCSAECSAADNYTANLSVGICVTLLLVISIASLLFFRSTPVWGTAVGFTMVSTSLWCTLGVCTLWRSCLGNLYVIEKEKYKNQVLLR
jgi:hypothetical protein